MGGLNKSLIEGFNKGLKKAVEQLTEVRDEI